MNIAQRRDDPGKYPQPGAGKGEKQNAPVTRAAYALLVIGFGDVMVQVGGPLGTVDPGQVVLTPTPGHVQDPEGKVMLG